jgi:hypothetical protein
MEYKTMPAEMKLGDCKIQNSESNWFALYACSDHEKRLAEQIEPRPLSCFLPSYHSVRRRNDRGKELDPVLFPGFVLVQMKLEDKSRVFELPGVVRLVSLDGRPAALPVGEIERLRERLSRSSRIEPHRDLRTGRRVRVTVPCKGQRESLCAGKNLAGLFSPSMSFSDQARSRLDEAELEMV